MSNLTKTKKNILVTGGCGFIGGTLIRRLLKETSFTIYNLDKIGYASNLDVLNLRKDGLYNYSERYHLIKANLASREETQCIINTILPDIVFHLAAESHVDKSISGPFTFLESNIIGTFNLLESLRTYWELLPITKKDNFRMLHISTDEVFGSLGKNGLFSETSKYDPRSPYSASKASSDHLVKAWQYTYGLPTIVTNCSNNYGPWQYPEKLIPITILKAISNKRIPVYGDGKNIRDWIYVEDHVDALLKLMLEGRVGSSYCIGASQEKTNNEVVDLICKLLDNHLEINSPHIRLKKYVKDRPGHDKRYALNSSKIKDEIKWTPKYTFEEGIELTVDWYLKNIDWCEKITKTTDN